MLRLITLIARGVVRERDFDEANEMRFFITVLRVSRVHRLDFEHEADGASKRQEVERLSRSKISG